MQNVSKSIQVVANTRNNNKAQKQQLLASAGIFSLVKHKLSVYVRSKYQACLLIYTHACSRINTAIICKAKIPCNELNASENCKRSSSVNFIANVELGKWSIKRGNFVYFGTLNTCVCVCATGQLTVNYTNKCQALLRDN